MSSRDNNITTKLFSGNQPPIIINKFPNEFKKNWKSTFDYKFLCLTATILLLSCLTIQFLLIKSDTYTTTQIPGLHKRYANFIDNSEYEQSLVAVVKNESTQTGTFLYLRKNAFHPTGSISSNAINNSKTGSLDGKFHQLANAVPRNNDQTTLTKNNSSNEPLALNNQLNLINTSSELSLSTMRTTNIKLADTNKLNQSLPKFNISRKLKTPKNIRTGHSIKQIGTDNTLLKDDVAALKPVNYAHGRDASRSEISQNSSPSSYRKYSENKLRTTESITTVLLSHNQTIKDCYRQILKSQPDLKGKITIRFSVSPNGIVQTVKIINSSLKNEEMERCILNRILNWKNFGEISSQDQQLYYKQTYVFGNN